MFPDFRFGHRVWGNAVLPTRITFRHGCNCLNFDLPITYLLDLDMYLGFICNVRCINLFHFPKRKWQPMP